MDKYAGQNNAARHLYPARDPFDQRMVSVGVGHVIYLEQSGNPDGIPVVVLHGGPGGGCSPVMRRFFDPQKYRVVLFDQRGCGRSRPYASVTNNTTWDLVADIELIRTELGIDRWKVFGGSWGATLALVYAQAHPSAVRSLILRGVFLATQSELQWFYGGGAGRFWPDVWQRFVEVIPEDERDDLIGAYHKRLFSGHMPTEMAYGKTWSAWENALASMANNGHAGDAPGDYARAFARLENHYFMNAAFLETAGQILRDMHKIAHIPGEIVQGRYDMICPPQSAWDLAQAWPNARLHMVRNAGHALSEPAISGELVRIMDRMAEQDEL